MRQTDEYGTHFADAHQRLHRLADPLSAQAFNWKPSHRVWSVGECIVHLNTMAAGYLPVLERVVAAPGAARASGPFRYGFASRMFIEAVRPGSRSLPTAPSMKPPPADGRLSRVDKARALEGLDRSTNAYIDVCHSAARLDLRRVRFRSPFFPVWFSLGAYLEALSLHAVRHTEQAERVANHAEFPG